MSSRKPCQFGAACYRRDAQHARDFTHPASKRERVRVSVSGSESESEVRTAKKSKKRVPVSESESSDSESKKSKKSKKKKKSQKKQKSSKKKKKGRGSFTLKAGDLLKAKTDYIAHQCNCITPGARGLAKALFAAFPAANVYKGRKRSDKTTHATPGTICIRGRVIALFGQVQPGAGKKSAAQSARREAWFKECLLAVGEEVPPGSSIAVPYLIGCGLAAGDWRHYAGMLRACAKASGLHIVCYRLGG